MPQPKYRSLDEFRAQAAAKGERPSGAVRKVFGGCEIKAVEGESRTLTIRITTGARDRDRDTIDPAGWDLSDYIKNPVVLYGHDYYGLPIAQDTGITQDAKGLLARPKFAEPEDYAFADTVYKLMRKGFLRAASVGMNPKVFQFNEEERGLDFKEQELLEYSIVCVPANPEALLEAKATGIDLAPLTAYAEQLLDTMHGERGLWVPRSSIERAFQIAGGEHLVVTVPKDLAAEQQAGLAKVFGQKRAISVDELLAVAKFASNVQEATAQLDAAITLHQAHLDGTTEPTPASQQAMMAQMQAAMAALDDDAEAMKRAAPTVKTPAPIPAPAPAPEELLFELVEESADSDSTDLSFDVDPDQLRSALQEVVTTAFDARLTALTGRLP